MSDKTTLSRREAVRLGGLTILGGAGALLGGCALHPPAVSATAEPNTGAPASSASSADDSTSATESSSAAEATSSAATETDTKPSPEDAYVKLDDASYDSTGFCLLADAVPDAIMEIRYYGTYNFVGDRIDGYQEPIAILCDEAAAALKAASDAAIEQGFRLKVWDAYRPQRAVNHFERWAEDLDDTRMKPYFYPELNKDVLFDLGYIDHRSGHSRGATVDLTLFDMAAGKELDMGGTFDYFGELSHPDYRATITDEQYDNRMKLQAIMVGAGYEPLPVEWWHFKLENEPYPDTFFDFPLATASVS